MVQNYVWRLHGVLPEAGGAEIVTRGRAYELRIDAELVDVHRLERLLLVAARAAETGAISNAAREALALFHGDPLADVADAPFATAVIHRLEELRLTACELAIDADLAAAATKRSSSRSTGCCPTTRCASVCTRNGCLASTAVDGRLRHLRRTGRPGRRWSRKSASSHGQSSGASMTRSCGRTQRWISNRPRRSFPQN